MIFLTLGTQEPFTRMVRAVDAWAARQPKTVTIIGQITDDGMREYTPQHFKAFGRTSPAEYADLMDQATLVLAHAGMGSILTTLGQGKPIVVMPRRAALGEHRNEHQLATVQHLGARPGLYVADDETQLPAILDQALHDSDKMAGAPIADTAQPALIDALRAFIQAS